MDTGVVVDLEQYRRTRRREVVEKVRLPDDIAELKHRLRRFKDAAVDLELVWGGAAFDGTEMEGTYDKQLPEFGELVALITALEVTSTASL